MKNILITVIVPIYNMEDYLEICIDSILEQNYKYFEIILVDDASTDASGALCDRLKEKDSRIRVIHKAKNEGLSEARNAGLMCSKGDYICFIDADDYIAENYLEVLLENALLYDADVSYCHYSCFYDELFDKDIKSENVVHRHSKEDLWELLASIGRKRGSTELVVAWNKLIRRNIAESICFPKGKWHEDEFYVNLLVDKAEKFVETEAQLYFYRQRKDSIMGADNYMNLRHMDIMDALEERVKICHRHVRGRIYQRMISAYRDTIIIQYHRFGVGDMARRLKRRLLKSYIKYPGLGLRQIKQHILFLINADYYYRKYWN